VGTDVVLLLYFSSAPFLLHFFFFLSTTRPLPSLFRDFLHHFRPPFLLPSPPFLVSSFVRVYWLPWTVPFRWSFVWGRHCSIYFVSPFFMCHFTRLHVLWTISLVFIVLQVFVSLHLPFGDNLFVKVVVVAPLLYKRYVLNQYFVFFFIIVEYWSAWLIGMLVFIKILFFCSLIYNKRVWVESSDFLNRKVYKGLEINSLTLRPIYKIGFQNRGREFTLPQLSISKFQIFIFWSYVNVDYITLLIHFLILGLIGSWCLCVPQTTQLFGFVSCTRSHKMIWNKLFKGTFN